MITVTLVLVLLLMGYFGSRWLKHAVYDAIGAELVEVGIFNVSLEGVTLKWLGASIGSLRFDVEKKGQRHRVSLTNISIQSSLTSIRQRRIQRISADELVVAIESFVPIESAVLKVVEEKAGDHKTSFPIPSDLFLLLPVDDLEINRYQITHMDNNWRVISDSGVVIKQGLLLTDFSFFYPELPEIEAALQLSANNQVVINLIPSLVNVDSSKQPAVLKLEGRISNHYKQLSASLSMDVDLKEVIGHSAYVQKYIVKLVGKDVVVSKGTLHMSANLTVNVDELLVRKMESVNDILASVKGSGVLQLSDIGVTDQGKKMTGLNGALDFEIKGSKWNFSTEAMLVENISLGVKFDAIESIFSGFFDIETQGFQLDVSSIDGDVLGGEMSFLPFAVTGPALSSEFELQFNGIELGKILELQSNQDLSGEGRLSGFTQVSINESVIEVDDGHFGSTYGHIRYKRNSVADAVSGSASEKGIAFVYDAMEDFQYTSLETGVTLRAPDDLFLTVELKGSNPNVEQGQILHLNLNLEQNIAPLIQAANIEGALQDGLLGQKHDE